MAPEPAAPVAPEPAAPQPAAPEPAPVDVAARSITRTRKAVAQPPGAPALPVEGREKTRLQGSKRVPSRPSTENEQKPAAKAPAKRAAATKAPVKKAAAYSFQRPCLFARCAELAGDGERLSVIASGLLGRRSSQR